MGALRGSLFLVVTAVLAAAVTPHPSSPPSIQLLSRRSPSEGFLVASTPLLPPAAIRTLDPDARPVGGVWWWTSTPPPPFLLSEPVQPLTSTFTSPSFPPSPPLDVEELWGRTDGDGVVVAVIDSGVDLSHPALRGRIWSNPGEVCGNGFDDDGNGYVDDCHGWDFVNSAPDPSPHPIVGGHGTLVAGLVAASDPEAFPPVSGVAPGATIMPLRFMVGSSGDTAAAVEAVTYAVANGADILNLSWGSFEPSRALAERLGWAIRSGVVVVAAAGNQGLDVSRTPFYPASLRLPGLISVAAISDPAALAPFSNYGGSGPHPSPDVAAPGVSVRSLGLGGSSLPSSGTSVSAPLISGLVALLRADPLSAHLSPAEIEERLVAATSPDAPPLPVRANAAVDPSRLLPPSPLPAASLRPHSVPRLSSPREAPAAGGASGPLVLPAAHPVQFQLEFADAASPASRPLIDGFLSPAAARLWSSLPALRAEIVYDATEPIPTPAAAPPPTHIPAPRFDPASPTSHLLDFSVSFPHTGAATLTLYPSSAEDSAPSLPLASLRVLVSSSPGATPFSPFLYSSPARVELSPVPVSPAHPSLCGDPELVSWVQLPSAASDSEEPWWVSPAGSTARTQLTVFPPAGPPFCPTSHPVSASVPPGSLLAVGASPSSSRSPDLRLRFLAAPATSPPPPSASVFLSDSPPGSPVTEGDWVVLDVPVSRPLWRDGTWAVFAPDGSRHSSLPASSPARLFVGDDGVWAASLRSPAGLVYTEISFEAANRPPEVRSASLSSTADGSVRLVVEVEDVVGEEVTLSVPPLPGRPAPQPLSTLVPPPASRTTPTGTAVLELELEPPPTHDLLWAPPPSVPSQPSFLSVPAVVSDGSDTLRLSVRPTDFVFGGPAEALDCLLLCP